MTQVIDTNNYDIQIKVSVRNGIPTFEIIGDVVKNGLVQPTNGVSIENAPKKITDKIMSSFYSGYIASNNYITNANITPIQNPNLLTENQMSNINKKINALHLEPGEKEYFDNVLTRTTKGNYQKLNDFLDQKKFNNERGKIESYKKNNYYFDKGGRKTKRLTSDRVHSKTQKRQ
uniref:Uncharacterized protein n=1 Tax=viral metagenome TaxID=1070528 RepID=A0A6C0D1G1_9ZZZZ